jgi:hypothetical protein
VTESGTRYDRASFASVRLPFLVPAAAAAALLVVVLCGLALFQAWYIMHVGAVGYDAHAYWLAGRSAHPYQAAPGQHDAFLYSPVFAFLMKPIAMLPWLWFRTLWMLAESVAFVWLVGPVRWPWRIPLLVLCLPEVTMGNIYGFLGVAAVVGVRRPEAWAFPLLTKITPGGVGLLWFAARGEWRKVARSVIATLALSAASFAAAPGLWNEWIRFLLRHGADNGAKVPVLLAVAAIVTVVAARSDRAWLLPVGMLLAVPTYTGKGKDLSMIVAATRLRGHRSTSRGEPVPRDSAPPRPAGTGPGRGLPRAE